MFAADASNPAYNRRGGQRAGAGRPKGVPNKINGDIKALVVAALHKAGGVDYLAERAIDQPVAFLGLVGKVLPLQVTGKDGAAIAVDFRWADAEPQTVAAETIAAAVIESEVVADETDLIEWQSPPLAND